MNFIQNSLITFVTRISLYLSTLFISIYIARVLGPESKGIYSLLINFSLILVMICLMGINSSSLYFVGSKKYRPQNVYLNGVVCVLTFITALLVIIFLFMRNIESFLLKDIPHIYIMIAVGFFPFLLLSRLLGGIFLGLNKVHIYNLANLFFSIFSLLFFLIFVIFFRLGLHGALWAYFFSVIFCFLFYYLLLMKEFPPRLKLDLRLISELVKYGFKTSLGHIFLLLNYRISYYFLNYFTDAGMVGIYSVAIAFVELILFIPESIGTVLFPKLSSLDLSKATAFTSQVARVLLFISVLGGILYYLIGGKVLLFVFGEQYSSSIAPMMIILPGIILLSLHHAFFRFFSSRGRPELTAKILFVTLLINAGLNFILIPRLNINGAAIASTVSFSICILLSILIFKKFSQVSFNEILLIKARDLSKIFKDLKLRNVTQTSLSRFSP